MMVGDDDSRPLMLFGRVALAGLAGHFRSMTGIERVGHDRKCLYAIGDFRKIVATGGCDVKRLGVLREVV